MIDYSPFWKTLEISEENWYTLTKKYHMSSSTLYRLKHNQDISMKTVNDLCRMDVRSKTLLLMYHRTRTSHYSQI